MKQLFFLVTTFFFCELMQAQNVGIGTNTPNNSAILELSTTNKGLLLPRVADTSSVAAPVRGLQVYSLASNKLWYYDGSRWQNSGNGNNMDTIWYMEQDTIAYSNKKYIAVNTDLSISNLQEGIQANGSLLMQGKLTHSNSAPLPAQIYTMTNLSAMQDIPGSDSVFRIYDPGGTGNYNNNMQGNIHFVFPNTETGYRVNSAAADYGLGTGDTLWLGSSSFPGCRTFYNYRFTAANPIPANFTITGTYYVIFRSNADGSNGRGFNLTFTRFYNKATKQLMESPGNALVFNSTNASFSAGLNTKAPGENATAFGQVSEATGANSFAAGFLAKATGNASFAGGNNSRASGSNSVALGIGNDASGDNSVALGGGNTASGYASFSVGSGNTASGGYSSAMGVFTTAAGEYSLVNGLNSNAEGDISAALGQGLQARGFSSTVVGMYNDPLVSSGQSSPNTFAPLFAIGNGTDNANRSNAMVVMRGGNVGIGINNPAFKLEVDRNILVRADDRPSVSIRNYDNVGGSMVIDADKNMEIGTNVWNTTGKLLFSLNNNVKLTIDVDGDSKLDGNMTFNKSSNTTLSLQANAVEKGFVQLSGNDLRVGTYSSNSTGRVILRSGGSDKLIVDDDGDVKVTNNLLVRGNKGIMSNANGSAPLKYYTKTAAFGASLPAFGTSGEGFITFPAGVFTTPPQVIVGDIVSTGGASGQLFRMQLVIYNVTTTGCSARLINTHNAPIDYSVTWNIILIGD